MKSTIDNTLPTHALMRMNRALEIRVRILAASEAAIAQLVEHLIRNEGVGSSNLLSGTTFLIFRTSAYDTSV